MKTNIFFMALFLVGFNLIGCKKDNPIIHKNCPIPGFEADANDSCVCPIGNYTIDNGQACYTLKPNDWVTDINLNSFWANLLIIEFPNPDIASFPDMAFLNSNSSVHNATLIYNQYPMGNDIDSFELNFYGISTDTNSVAFCPNPSGFYLIGGTRTHDGTKILTAALQVRNEAGAIFTLTPLQFHK